MKDYPVVTPSGPEEMRAWLEGNHASSNGTWVVIQKKDSPRPGVDYETAVDEAVCYGWIDSRQHPRDESSYQLWFSPRKPDSIWSRSNKDRAARLTAAGRMCPAGLSAIETAKANGSWNALDDIENLVIPPDFQAALDADAGAAAYYSAFSDSNKMMILRWLDAAKTPATRARRIAETTAAAAQNQLPHH